MVFSSNIFLFLFLPVFLIIYFLTPTIALKNIIILLFSLYFYAYGEPVFFLIMIVSIIFNYLFALIIHYFNSLWKKIFLIVSIFFNFGILFFFKYLDFSIRIFNKILHFNLNYYNIALPIGISFFTFQSASYVFDVYINEKNKKDSFQINPLYLGLYVSMFPQLIAGPIVRYSDIAKDIPRRKHSLSMISNGIELFILGLASKVLLSNNMAIIADRGFVLNLENTGGLLAIISSIAYFFQIYFDFSGYSLMAIGLGKIIGFNFNKNFDYPYIATSMKDFWKRWHISLSSWFRDYIYIPLGGSRKGHLKTYVNLFIVWILTGLWHGANFTFVLWGLHHFLFISLEKFIFEKTHFQFDKYFRILSWIFTMIIVWLGWIIFRSYNVSYAFGFIKSMFNFTKNTTDEALFYINEFKIFFIFAILCSTKFFSNLHQILINNTKIIYQVVYICILFILLYLSSIYIIKGSYNPFIYFNF